MKKRMHTRRVYIYVLLTLIFCSPEVFSQEKEEVNEGDKITKLFFFRHAEVDKESDPKNPKLSEKGKQRAKALVQLFEKEDIDAIYSTDLIRTKNTVMPIADKLGKEIASYHPFQMDLEQFLKENEGKTVLIVGHSNTNPVLINTIIGQEKYATMEANNFSSIHVVYYLSKGKAWATELTFYL